MKLLLTSGGVTNDSIRDELLDLLGKPISKSSALFIPTAQWGQPQCSPESVWRSVADRWQGQAGVTGMGWESVGVLELTALPPGEHLVVIRVADSANNTGTTKVVLR